MSNPIAIGSSNEADAVEMRAALAKLRPRDMIEMEDVVVVMRDAQGNGQWQEAVNLTAAGRSHV